MRNNFSGFLQGKTGMQETRHLAQLRIDGATLFDLLDCDSPFTCFSANLAPATQQENHEYKAHRKDGNNDIVHMISTIGQGYFQPIPTMQCNPSDENQ